MAKVHSDEEIWPKKSTVE